MDVIRDIVQYSAISTLTKWYKSLVVLIFTLIVVMLLTMLFLLLKNGSEANITYGYLYAI